MKTRKRACFLSGAGFSLVEVVIALGLVTFVMVTLIGLFSVGLTGVRKSEVQVQGSNLAMEILNRRLSAPVSTLTNFSIPVLSNLATTPPSFSVKEVGPGGYISSRDFGTYRLSYRAWRDTNAGFGQTNLARLHVILSSPADAPLSAATEYYEAEGSVFLP